MSSATGIPLWKPQVTKQEPYAKLREKVAAMLTLSHPGQLNSLPLNGAIHGCLQEFMYAKPAIAQLVEHLTVGVCSNQMVPGSIPGGRRMHIQINNVVESTAKLEHPKFKISKPVLPSIMWRLHDSGNLFARSNLQNKP